MSAHGTLRTVDGRDFIWTENHRTLRPHWMRMDTDVHTTVRVFPPLPEITGGNWWVVVLPNRSISQYPRESMAFEAAASVPRSR